MPVRLNIPALLALVALLLGAGCGGADAPFTSETDEPAYQQAKQLEKQGRQTEALSLYYKVIAKRGDNAPESCLDAGVLLSQHVKNHLKAIYFFERYLELQPNSQQARYVKGLIAGATREWARTVPGIPQENQAAPAELVEENDRLRRENERLQGELTAQRGGAPALVPSRDAGGPGIFFNKPVVRATPEPITAAPLVAEDSPVTLAPVATRDAAAVRETLATRPSAGRVPVPPARPAAVPRKHAVAHGDTLYKIAVKYYGSGARMNDIFNANRDVMPNVNTLPRLGTALKIP